MDFEQKVIHFREEMEYLGICQFSAAPILYRVLWFLGLQEPPPFFASRWRTIGLQTLCLSLLMSFLLMTSYIFFSVDITASFNLFIIFFIFNVFYSFYAASSYRYHSQMLELPEWEVYLSELPRLNEPNIS
ncbi:DUF6404 family protein [Psychrosphaera sp.]|nr:DUF6404 family protein [Psychrosphaera sp.]